MFIGSTCTEFKAIQGKDSLLTAGRILPESLDSFERFIPHLVKTPAQVAEPIYRDSHNIMTFFLKPQAGKVALTKALEAGRASHRPMGLMLQYLQKEGFHRAVDDFRIRYRTHMTDSFQLNDFGMWDDRRYQCGESPGWSG
jgi:hypothetical protein